MKKLLNLLFLSLIILSEGLAQPNKGMSSNQLETNLAGLRWRNIGPQRGGRANAITGVITNDQIYYAGYTGGGVWKTTDAGAFGRIFPMDILELDRLDPSQ